MHRPSIKKSVTTGTTYINGSFFVWGTIMKKIKTFLRMIYIIKVHSASRRFLNDDILP